MAKTDRLEEFSTLLLRYFRASGWSQAQLAEVLTDQQGIPVTGSGVGEWLRAKSEPSRDKVFALERVFEVDPGTFSRLLGYDPVVPGTRRSYRAGEKPTLEAHDIHIAASGVDLNELAEIDPEAYAAIMRQAEIALDRARDRRRG